MIEEFSFGNFWSFKDIQTLKMTAAKIKSFHPSLDIDNVISVNEDVQLLKAKAIYGANASGKSNIIKAIGAFIKTVMESVKDDRALERIMSFELSTETSEKPSFFQIIFRLENTRYRYGFEADAESIKSEWLFSTPNKREQPLFIREEDKIITINQKHFEEGYKSMSLMDGDNNDQIFRNNSLFLSSLASFGFGKLSKRIIQSLSEITIISGLGHSGMYGAAGNALSDAVQKKFILDFLKNADVGIEDLDTVEIASEDIPESWEIEVKNALKKRKIIVSSRTKYNANLESDGLSRFSFGLQESEGTRKMFELSPFIYRSLKEGSTLIIDEFDARFHPLLTKKIVELFNSSQNPNAQIIFITHDTNLLSSELLRRDQIDFVEKDRYGASHLYTLVELKGVRNNASLEKDYIQGKYGAIPFLGDFTTLITLDNA
ncbi:MAG: ATP-binding protein [Chitinophaga sp.]|uniref:AAA family ATPase n=1 Tax=Chitinophaga sp. TaxID=1869181 RepID=UPI0025B8C755|nr:ATP-binding protein [Chitinophaga sp.]MBV8251803.1 ATP-binding protein [Chitinophaga sp.]